MVHHPHFHLPVHLQSRNQPQANHKLPKTISLQAHRRPFCPLAPQKLQGQLWLPISVKVRRQFNITVLGNVLNLPCAQLVPLKPRQATYPAMRTRRKTSLFLNKSLLLLRRPTVRCHQMYLRVQDSAIRRLTKQDCRQMSLRFLLSCPAHRGNLLSLQRLTIDPPPSQPDPVLTEKHPDLCPARKYGCRQTTNQSHPS